MNHRMTYRNLTIGIIGLSLLLLWSPPTIAGSGSSLWSAYRLPGVAHVPGANGTYWKTDVSIVNPYSWRTITVKIKFLEANKNNVGASTITTNVGPGQSKTIPDIIGGRFGKTASGALWLWTDDGSYFSTAARTYTGNSSTFGQTINGQKAVGKGSQVAYITGIRQDSGFRTNVGGMNTAASSIQLKFEVFNDNGVRKGSKILTLLPQSYAQIPVSSFASNFGTGWVKVTCLSSSDSIEWNAFASVVDNNSGDAVYLEERVDREYTKFQPYYDSTGWWYGHFSGPAGSDDVYVLISQSGAEVVAYPFTPNGWVQGALLGYENKGTFVIEGGYSFQRLCWYDYVSNGSATVRNNEISGSYQGQGSCIAGTTTFYVQPTSPPKFAAATSPEDLARRLREMSIGQIEGTPNPGDLPESRTED